MEKLNFTFLLTILMSMVGVKAFAYDIAVNNDDGVTIYYNYINDNKELEVTNKYYGCYTRSVKIPESVTYNSNTYSVTSIGDEAFSHCRDLSTVSIPLSVTSIGNGAFIGCTSLYSVTIIGNSVTSIGNSAFNGCTNLTSITIPNSVTSIGNSAFNGCTRLTSITIPNSVTTIGGLVFYRCTGLISVSIGNSVTSISEDAFNGCTRLTSIKIPNSVTSIGDRAFSDCNLISVTIPNSVTSIGSSAFRGCSSLTSVTIGYSVTSIGYDAFYGCSGLTSITIPDGVTSIGESAFEGTAWYDNLPDGLVYAGKVAYKYKGTMPYNTSITIKYGTLEITGSAFADCLWRLTSVNIPNSVTSIGRYAFCECRSLTSITIPNSVTSIGEYAFSGCSGLTSINVESGNTAYDSRNNCNAIIETATNTLIQGCQNTIIPNNVTSIGASAFEKCSALTSITIPDGVTGIGASAFEECSALTSITIPDGVTSIGNGAFSGCSGLTSITIPNSVTSIGHWAFWFCTGLTSVVSLIEEPFDINYYVFSDETYSNATLYVPDGTIDKYKATESWNKFLHIEEGATGINDIKEDLSKQYRYYDLNGNQSLQPRKGLNIMKSSDGKAKKVVVK